VAASRALTALRKDAATCTDCPLYRRATQTVFGEGPAPAPLLLIGEQPGDREDREGRPFVGPAGTLLDHVLADAGIDRDLAYVTNAVKHFKWVSGGAGGKVRIHKSPSRAEVVACSICGWRQTF
jgi:DNA polymerase